MSETLSESNPAPSDVAHRKEKEHAANDKLIAELRRQRDHYLAESERLARVAQEEMTIRKRQEGLADRLIAELRGGNERVGKDVKAIYEVMIPERDSLRAQLEDLSRRNLNANNELLHVRLAYKDLRAQLETARQHIEHYKRQRDEISLIRDRLQSDRDKALRVAEEAQKENNALTVQVGVCKRAVAKLWQAVADGCYDARSLVGDETLSMKEVLFGDQWPPIDKLQFDLSTLRGLVDEMAEAGLPFKRLADVFDDVRYREQWPDHTRLNGSTPAALTNNTIALHNFLTLGDCRKLKAIVNKLDAARHTALKAGRV